MGKTKKELRKEIKELRAADREAALLRSANRKAALLFTEKDNEIKELKADLEFANTAHRDKDSDITRLRMLLGGVSFTSRSDRAAVFACVDVVVADKNNEINDLEDVVRANDALISRQVKEIQGFELVCDAKANAIKDLQGTLKIVRDISGKNVYENGQLRQELATSRDYSDKQADVIRNYLKQIADLERRLELSERFSGNKEFHNATVAMGNPQYFHGVSSD